MYTYLYITFPIPQPPLTSNQNNRISPPTPISFLFPRREECDDPRRRVSECPNDPREADPCDRDGPSLATHCGGDLTLCGSDDECATRLICWERCFPCNDRETCDKLVEIGTWRRGFYGLL